jgi:hypothetical protein
MQIKASHDLKLSIQTIDFAQSLSHTTKPSCTTFNQLRQ